MAKYRTIEEMEANRKNLKPKEILILNEMKKQQKNQKPKN